MSYARAIEGDTNDQVLDAAFHRQVQPSSVAESMKRAGVPQPPVESITQPRIFSFPRPASPNAASDLKGQQGLTVALDRITTNRARIIGKQQKAQTTREKKILMTAGSMIRRRQSGLHGMGQDDLLVDTAPATIQMVSVLDPAVIAAKVETGAAVTSQEAAVWGALSPAARGAYIALPLNIATLSAAKAATTPVSVSSAVATAVKAAVTPAVTAATPVSTAGLNLTSLLNQQAIAGIPNSYLLAGVAGLAVVLGLKKKR
jgi:hypothetical protein